MTSKITASKNKEFIDPDPFTIMSLLLSGVGVLLQFVQVHKSNAVAQEPSNFSITPNRETNLTHLSDALTDARRMLDRVIKEIDRGSNNPDEEFYETKFGLSLGIMKLELTHHKLFQNNLAQLFTKMGALSTWSNNIIGNDDELANELGQMITTKCNEAHIQLNQMIQSGATNGQILAEAKYIFDQVTSVLDTFPSEVSND